MDENPYRAHQLSEKPAALVGQLQLNRMYAYVFENPNWLLNILFVTVAQFIPIIGPIVVLGYQYEIIQSLHLSPARTYPDFDFNRFMDYLKRGVWPFLVALVTALLLIPVILLVVLVIGGVMALLADGAQNDEATMGLVGLILIPLAVLGYLALIIGLHLVLVPLQLRAGLAQDFMVAFNLAFVRDFIAKTWKEMLLGVMFLMATSFVGAIAGMLAFCIGTYFAISIVFLAQAHFYWQLYEVYLARGGEPITMPDVVMPMVAGPY